MSNVLRNKQKKLPLTVKDVESIRRQIKSEIYQEVNEKIVEHYEEKIFIAIAVALREIYGYGQERIVRVWERVDELKGEMDDPSTFEKYQKYLADTVKIMYVEDKE